MGDFIRLFDYFVFPSLEEGLGSTLLDILEAKVPVVASNVGIPDIIHHEQTGLLVDSGSSEQIVAALERLMCSPTLVAEIVNRGAALVLDHHPRRIAQRYWAVYQSTFDRLISDKV